MACPASIEIGAASESSRDLLRNDAFLLWAEASRMRSSRVKPWIIWSLLLSVHKANCASCGLVFKNFMSCAWA